MKFYGGRKEKTEEFHGGKKSFAEKGVNHIFATARKASNRKSKGRRRVLKRMIFSCNGFPPFFGERGLSGVVPAC